MRVNKSIGEVGIKVDGRGYLLRPSFLALSQLGTPSGIVRKFKLITSVFECLKGWRKFPVGVSPLAAFGAVKEVIDACITDGNAHDITGHVVHYDGKGLRHKQGALSYHDLVVLSFHLMRYGVHGDPKPRKKESGSTSELTSFDPAEAVGMAVGQFGMSLSDAWNLTMIEYQRAFDGKYPEQDDTKEQQRINQKEYDDLMSWHDKVREYRRKKAAEK